MDLFLDVLVRQDTRTYQVRDQDEFDRAQRAGLISPAEAAGARAGLAALVGLIEAGCLLSFLSGIVVFGRSAAPAALPESVVALAEVERLKDRHGMATGHRARSEQLHSSYAVEPARVEIVP